MNRFISAGVRLANSSRYGVQGLHRCSTTACPTKEPVVKDVPGLSKKVVDVPHGTTGFPGAAKDAEYKNPEYFSYHNTSYFEAEVEMLKYRLPQPSNKPKN